ncbi:10352_t:CDS:2 [Dentiscutata heterogama]|uniref:10352_t:CDS:1 n=1 Tax=Dentiscutata heterogama TaxID=1316150 RepID=A0ACA9LB44_9GLOM|nr:10352_t:CDS:2 [Dentiscutata heterogama]
MKMFEFNLLSALKKLLQKNEKNQLRTKIIKYSDRLLTEHGNEICSEFFKKPFKSFTYADDPDWIGYGDISMSVYDTAWVAMIPSKIYKESNISKNFSLAFPQCFLWLLNNQDMHGSWAGSGSGGIVPGLAGLLALGLFRLHSGEFFEIKLNDLGITIEQFIATFEKAKKFLQKALNEWNLDNFDMICYELIIPYHLSALARLKEPVVFDFPESERILQEGQRKMSLIPLDKIIILAKSQPITLIHSIEVFCEKLDLSQIQNKNFQAINGSYGSSPAATASVLLHAQKWDDKAFEFLEKIISNCPSYAKDHGLVPTICDVGLFETIWMLHSIGDLCLNIRANEKINLMSKHIFKKKLFPKNLALIKYLSALNKEHGGTIRWTSWDNKIPKDADDSTVCNWLLKKFDSDGAVDLDIIKNTIKNEIVFIRDFIIIPERTFSISCNVHAINLFVSEYQSLQSNNQNTYIIRKFKLEEIIVTATNFLISQREKDGIWFDKWNKSPSYVTFKANNLLLSLQEHPNIYTRLGFTTEKVLRDFCRKTVDWALITQHDDGSWGEPSNIGPGNLEETSYTVRLLKTASKNWLDDKKIKLALYNGRKYLIKHLDEAMKNQGYFHTKQPFLWIGKQYYTVPRVIKSSILASLWDD